MPKLGMGTMVTCELENISLYEKNPYKVEYT